MEREKDNFKNGDEVKRLKSCALALSPQAVAKTTVRSLGLCLVFHYAHFQMKKN